MFFFIGFCAMPVQCLMFYCILVALKEEEDIINVN